MKLTLSEPKYLSESISVISELVNEAKFKILKDRIEMVAMDPANVVMVIFKLLSSAFTEYEVDGETEIVVNLDKLKQILRRAKPSDVLVLELDDETNKLRVLLKGENVRTFNLSLLGVGEEQQRVPNLNFPIKIEAPCFVFGDAVEDVSIVAESVSLISSAKKLTIRSDGTVSDAKVEVISGDEIKIVSDGKKDISAKYSIEYLKKIVKAGKLADSVVIQFNKDYPLMVQYKVVDKMDLSFILAPRISSD